MAYPNTFFRRFNYARQMLAGMEWSEAPAQVDIELNDIQRVLTQHNAFIRSGFNSDMTLKQATPRAAMDLLALTRFTATADQTDFTMTEYDEVNDVVVAYSGSTWIDTANIVKTDSTTVTLPAQDVGTIVTILIFTSGSGTLANLAATDDEDLGGRLVGLFDAGGLFDSDNLEDGMAELMTDLNTFINAIGTVSDYVKKDGTVTMTGNLNAGGNKITNLAASTINGQAVRHEQLTALIAQIAAATSTFLAKTGGTMSGAIDMATSKITTLGAPTEGSSDAATALYVDQKLTSFGGLPIGTTIDYAGTAAPLGWLECNGAAISRTTYANLFAIIGTTWGVGDGSTTFTLPDCRGRVRMGAGAGSGLTVRAIADSVGAEEVVLDTTMIPAHTHTFPKWDNTGSSAFGDGGGSSSTSTSSSTGGGLGHPNVQPSVVFMTIVKY